MKTLRLILFFITLYCIDVFPQQQIYITRPDLAYRNNTLIITFDIKGCEQSDLFNINPVISVPDGSTSKASSLTGDLGDSIKCGNDKRIIWDMSADGVMMEGDVEVQIIAEQILTTDTDAESEDISDQEIRTGTKDHTRTETGTSNKNSAVPAGSSAANYSRGNIIASSLAFPGLGQKKASRKKGPLLLGVIGYGSLAVSGYFIYDYNKKYNLYLESESGTERNELFEDSEKSYKRAQYLIYGAAGVWAVNLIWSAIIPASTRSGFNAGVSQNNLKGINLHAKWTF